MIIQERQIEAEEILDLMCELVKARIDLITREKQCPTDMTEAVHTLIWAAPRTSIDELKAVRQQFIYKYTEPWCMPAIKGEGPDCRVNDKVKGRLTNASPDLQCCAANLAAIAKTAGVPFDPEKDLAGSLIGLAAAPAGSHSVSDGKEGEGKTGHDGGGGARGSGGAGGAAEQSPTSSAGQGSKQQPENIDGDPRYPAAGQLQQQNGAGQGIVVQVERFVDGKVSQIQVSGPGVGQQAYQQLSPQQQQQLQQQQFYNGTGNYGYGGYPPGAGAGAVAGAGPAQQVPGMQFFDPHTGHAFGGAGGAQHQHQQQQPVGMLPFPSPPSSMPRHGGEDDGDGGAGGSTGIQWVQTGAAGAAGGYGLPPPGAGAGYGIPGNGAGYGPMMMMPPGFQMQQPLMAMPMGGMPGMMQPMLMGMPMQMPYPAATLPMQGGAVTALPSHAAVSQALPSVTASPGYVYGSPSYPPPTAAAAAGSSSASGDASGAGHASVSATGSTSTAGVAPPQQQSADGGVDALAARLAALRASR